MMGAGGGAGANGAGFSGSTGIYARAGDGGNGLTTVTAAGTLFANGYSSGGIAGGGGGAALAFSDRSAVSGTNAYGGGIGASLGGLSTSVATSSTQGGRSTGGGGGGGVRTYIGQVEKLFNAAQGGSGRVVIRFVAAQGPTVTTGTAASVTSSTATLNATVAANGLPSVVSSFKYATTLGGVDSATPQAATAPGPGAIDLPITGLAPGTTYYFNAYSSDSSAILNSSGTAGSFTTDAAAPSVTTGAATSVASTTATLPGTVNANGAATSALTIKYSATQADVDAGGGTAATVSPTSATGAGDTSVSAAVTGLSAGTTYYYRVSATNSVGTTNGSTRSFTPLDAPSVTTGAATSVAATSATLPGTVNAKGAATSALTIKYSTTQADVDAGGGTAATVSPASATGGSDTSVSAAVTGLSASTTYYYRASATNSVGTTNGSTRSFTTTASGGGGGGSSTPSTDTPTTTPTTPTTVTPAAPSPLGPQDGPPLTPGGTTVTTGGQPTPVTTVPNKTRGTVTSSGDDWSLTTGGRTAAGKSQPTSPTGVVQVPQGGSVVVSGKGYEPGTSVQVYAMNPALLLGTFTVGADGTFRDSVTWPAGLGTGAGVLQVNGFSINGAVRSYSLGLGVIKDASGKVRTVEQTVYFAAGSSWLSPTAKATLAKTVASVPKGARLVSVVATGYVQGTRDRSNDFTLSTARATKVAAQMKADKLAGKYYVTGHGVAKESGALGRKVIVTVTYR
jgi:outer membrane protein OmpA-like peptidoglycan-associated protein